MDIMLQIGGWITTIAGVLFVIVSIVLFIRDGIAAKKEGRRRKEIYNVLFIAGIAITATAIMVGIFVYILASLVMRSM